MNKKEYLVQLLQEAYALEGKLVTMLDTQASDLEDEFPEVAQRLHEHHAETENHAELIEQCLNDLDEEASDLKAFGGKTMAMMEGLLLMIRQDKPVKYGAASYAVEHLEIAHYRSLRAVANDLGHDGIVSTCDTILSEEQHMADWLEEHLDTVVLSYLKSLE